MKNIFENYLGRKPNFELLRIIAMLLIIFCHCSDNLFFDYISTASFSVNIVFQMILIPGGQFGNTLFVLISGFFLVSSTFTWKKWFKIYLQAFFYSILFMLIFCIFKISYFDSHSIINLSDKSSLLDSIHYVTISLEEILTSFGILVFLGTNSWFAGTYLIFYLFVPVLNQIVTKVEKMKLRYLVICLLIICGVLNIIPFIQKPMTSCLSSFFTLYFLAAYYRLYPEDFENIRHPLLFGIIGYLLLLIIAIVPTCILRYGNFQIPFITYYFSRHQDCFYDLINGMGKITMIIPAFLILLGFDRFKIRNPNCIAWGACNCIGNTTFGIYLIHENRFMRKIIWLKIFGLHEYFYSTTFIIREILCVICVFLICSMIEFIRKNTIEYVSNKVLQRVFK